MKKFRTRKLDSNGDIATSGVVWIYDLEAVAQTIETRLRLFSGEYWRDVTDGTPWIERILSKNNQTNTLQAKTALIKSRILNTEHVISILAWEADFSYTDRKYSVNATILTDFGIVNVVDSSTDPSQGDQVEDNSINSMLVAVQAYAIAATEVSVSL